MATVAKKTTRFIGDELAPRGDCPSPVPFCHLFLQNNVFEG